MARLIEVQSSQQLPANLTVCPGDLLVFRATGWRVGPQNSVLEALGPYVPATIGPDGQVISAVGGPDSVGFLARQPGSATVELISGDAWHGPTRTRRIKITVAD